MNVIATVPDDQYFPWLDSIDYIEIRNPWSAKLYYSLFEEFSTELVGPMAIFAKYKKECIDMIISHLYRETHTHIHHLSSEKWKAAKFINLEEHQQNIEVFLQKFSQSPDFNDQLVEIFRKVMLSGIKKIVDLHNKGIPKTSNMVDRILGHKL